MNEQGFIKLFRQFEDWGWYKDANTMRVFLHLLLNANYKDGEFMGQEVKRGQLIIGRKKIAEKLGITEQNVKTAINHLKSTNEITTKVTNKWTLVTIVKYEFYQGRGAEGNQQSNQQTNQQLTSNQPTTNQQLTTIEERKKERKEIIKEYIRERSRRYS